MGRAMAPTAGLRKFRFGTAALVAIGGVLAFSALRMIPSTFCITWGLRQVGENHEARNLRRSVEPSAPSFPGSAVPILAGVYAAAVLIRARGRAACRALEDDSKHGKVNEEMTEHAVEELERKMISAAEAEKFEEAAKYEKELQSAQLDDEVSVLHANKKFYEALNERSLVDMKKCWYKVAFAQCIHPYDESGHHHTGYSDICASFERIFKESKQQSQVVYDRVKVNVRGGTAVVTCLERITGKNHRTTLRASHIFRKSTDSQHKWKMMHRHASKPPGEGSNLEADEDAYREFQRVMRAAQSLGNSVVIRAPFFAPEDVGDHDDDGPFGIGAKVDEDELDHEDDDEDSDLENEIFVDEEEEEEEDEMFDAREAIRGLRKLETEGVLTREQKVLLLAEMSDNPKENMAERAFVLLLRDVEDKEEYDKAWQDFADLLSLQVQRLEKSKSLARKRQDKGTARKS